MAEVVSAFGDSVQRQHVIPTRSHEGDEAGGIRAECEEHEIVDHPHLHGEARPSKVCGRGFEINFRLRLRDPFLTFREVHFQLADTGDVLREGIEILAPDLALDLFYLAHHEIQHAASVAHALDLNFLLK